MSNDANPNEQTDTARALPAPPAPPAPGETLARDVKSLSEFYDGNLQTGAEALVFDGNRRFRLDRDAKDGVVAFSGNGAWVEIAPPAPPQAPVPHVSPPHAPPPHGNGHGAPQQAYPQQAAPPLFPPPQQAPPQPYPPQGGPPYAGPPGAPYAAPQPMPQYPPPPPQSMQGHGFPPPGQAYAQPPPGQPYAQYQQPPPGPYPQQQPQYPPQPQPQYPAYGQPYAQPAPQFQQPPIPPKQAPPALAVTDFKLETSPTTVYTDPSAVWSQLDEQGKELVWHAMAIGMLLEPGMLKQHGIATMAALMRALHDPSFRQMMTEQLAQQHAQANAFMAQQRAQGQG